MILVDISQLIISSIMVTEGIKKNEIDENIVKHIMLTCIMSLKLKFGKDYGKIIICCDSKTSWRKNVFKYYKFSRKKERDNSFIDWDKLYETIAQLKKDLKINFPYKVIEVDLAEADDIIAVLCRNSCSHKEKTIIISSDKDYKSLQKYSTIDQYCPRKKDFIKVKDPVSALRELVIRGDRADSIPNIRSDSDTFVKKGKRQGNMTKALFEEYMIKIPEELQENYNRNEQLINFDFIPDDICNSILEEFSKPIDGSRQSMYQYFVSNNMQQLLLEIGKF